MTADTQALIERLLGDPETSDDDAIEAAFLIQEQDARIQALEAKCAELERDAAWRPIETAPRSRADGYCWMHLAWGPEGDVSTGVGMRWGDRFFAAGTFHCLGQKKRYEFREIEVQPTHWMPLYAAPIATQAGSKEGT